MDKFCVSCGAELPEGANFCPECGESIGAARGRRQAPSRGEAAAGKPGSSTARRSGRRPKAQQAEGWLGPYRLWAFGGAAATVVILVFIGMQNRGSNSSGSASPSLGPAQTSNLQQQIQAAQNTLMQDPGNLAAMKTLANAYFDAGTQALRQGDVTNGSSFLEQSVAYYLRALEETPESPELRTDLGTAYNRLNRKQEAIAEFEKALEYRPGFLTAMFNLGVVHEQMGKKEAAKEWYGRVVEAAPASALGRSASEHLRALESGM